MKIRLVAYRKAASAATATTAYNLDLQEAPNVSLNFQSHPGRFPYDQLLY